MLTQQCNLGRNCRGRSSSRRLCVLPKPQHLVFCSASSESPALAHQQSTKPRQENAPSSPSSSSGMGRRKREGAASRMLLSSGNGTVATHLSFDPVQRALERKLRFSKLLELRALYRNYIRAKALLSMPSPVYKAAEPAATGPAATNGEGRGEAWLKANVCLTEQGTHPLNLFSGKPPFATAREKSTLPQQLLFLQAQQERRRTPPE